MGKLRKGEESKAWGSLLVSGTEGKHEPVRKYRHRECRGISDRVHLVLEYINNDDVSAFFGAADLIVVPYRQVYQSGVALMAMSYGLPVVASDLDAMRETIKDRETGYLFRTGDADALANTLEEAGTNRRRRTDIAREAYRKYMEDRSWTGIGRATARTYRLT